MTDLTHAIVINPALRVLRWLPGALLRTYFTPERMATLMRFEVRPRGEQLVFHGGDAPHVRLWLPVESQAPFPVTLDRAKVEFYAPGRLGDVWYLEPRVVAPGCRVDLYVSGLFGARFPPSILANVRTGQGAITVKSVFSSKVGNFVKLTGRLEGIRGDCFNYDGGAA